MSSSFRLASDDGDDWAGLSLVPPSGSLDASPPVSTTHSPLLVVWLPGGLKQNLWVYPSSKEGSKPCLDQVGSTKFCTKVLEGSASSCSIMQHGSHKFNILVDAAYIKFNDIQAFCTPSFPFKTLSEPEQDVLLSSSATASMWELTLKALEKGIDLSGCSSQRNQLHSYNPRVCKPWCEVSPVL
jgi:hypothetical protein